VAVAGNCNVPPSRARARLVTASALPLSGSASFQYSGRLVASPSRSLSKVRPRHSAGRRRAAIRSARSADTQSESRRKPAARSCDLYRSSLSEFFDRIALAHIPWPLAWSTWSRSPWFFCLIPILCRNEETIRQQPDWRRFPFCLRFETTHRFRNVRTGAAGRLFHSFGSLAERRVRKQRRLHKPVSIGDCGNADRRFFGRGAFRKR